MANSLVTVGMDPGKSGGLVALEWPGARPIEWWAADHPTDGYYPKGRGTVLDVASVADWLRDLGTHRRIIAAVAVEQQQARGTEGRGSILTIGRGWGRLEGAVLALHVPLLTPTARDWKHALRVPAAKDGAVAACRQRLPALPLTWRGKKKPHDGIAEAGLLALWAAQEVRL